MDNGHSERESESSLQPPDDHRGSGDFDERQLRAIIQQLADGIIIVGSDGVIRFANPAAEQLFARSARHLAGTEFGFPIVNGSPSEIEVLRPNGETLTAELRVVRVTWGGEDAHLVSIRDVTDRRRAEERARLVARERLARAEAEAANQAKSDFLATMSHELRTPLNAVIGYAQLLQLGIGGPLTTDQLAHVERILSSSRHLLGLVNEVLDMTKVDAGQLALHLAPAPAAAAVDAAVALAQPMAEARGIGLSVQTNADRSVRYQGDEDRVRQILVNLLTNAIKFTTTGGRVSVEFGQVESADAPVRLPGSGEWSYFTVRDSGSGIPNQKLSQIFEPFVQVASGHTRPSDGSGLGLAISRRLARLMHGDITVTSKVDDGSTFTLWIPAAAPHESRALEARPANSADPARLPGLGEVGELLLRELKPLLDAFVAQLRADCPGPGVDGLRFSQIADHLASYIADLASTFISVEEASGKPSAALADGADIQRLVAMRHGSQRARLGWTEESVRFEHGVIREAIEKLILRNQRVIGAAPVREALTITSRLLDEAEETALRAFARAGGGAFPDTALLDG